MAGIRPITREHRIYLALWRKAFLTDQEVRVKTSNFAMAVAMRQGMYRAIKPFRHNEISDSELRDASEKYVVYLIKNIDEKGVHLKDKPHWLEFRPRATLNELDTMLADLEIEEDDLLIGEERGISKKIKELAKSLPSKKQAKTPFYERD